MVAQIKDDQFEAMVLQSSTPVLVDFWAEWCGPCRALAPTLEEIGKELEGKVTILKMNVDDSPETPSKFGIRSIPTLILFKDGKQVGVKVGGGSKESLTTWIESLT